MTKEQIKIELLLSLIETTMYISAYLASSPSGYNPIFSVGYMILTAVNAGLVFAILGVDPIALFIVMIFAGGLAIIMMFTVKMLELKGPFSSRRKALSAELYFFVIFGLIFPILLLFTYGTQDTNTVLHYYLTNESALSNGIVLSEGYTYYPLKLLKEMQRYFYYYDFINSPSSLESIGLMLYTKYIVVFILSGLILLLAMIGSIAITLNYDLTNKKQHIFQQVSRNAKNAVFKIS